MTAAYDIDRIVREVVKRLREMEQQSSAKHGSAKNNHSSNASPGTLVLAERVIAMATLEKRLDAISRVSVSERAVVTPAVRDELRRKKIELVFETKNQTASATPTKLILAVVGKSSDAARLRNNFGGDVEIMTFAADEHIAATAYITKKITGDHKNGIILTNEPATALCLANRSQGVRAAAANDASAVGEVVKQIGANLLIVDSSRVSQHEVRGIADAFSRCGDNPCPAAYRQLLQ